jgi:hypothetical protein
MSIVNAFRLSHMVGPTVNLIVLAMCLAFPATVLAVDADGDGYHSIATGGTDCDDGDPNRNPGRAEVCDVQDKDEDCNLNTFGIRDVDGDGHPDGQCCNGANCGSDCNDALRGVSPDSPEVCNGLDDDCDGGIDSAQGVGSLRVNSWPDLDRDSWGENGVSAVPMCPDDLLSNLRSGVQGDCNDKAASIHPGAPEMCNGLDDNCNGVQDDDLSGAYCD